MSEDRGVHSYRDLRVWNVGLELAEDCYRLSAKFPRAEQYGLTSQVRRSAASIPANIAEGYGRDQIGCYIQSLRVAQGSLKELETHLLLSRRLGLVVDIEPQLKRCEELGKMLRALIRSLERLKH
jgi:four helix bundle protein